MATEASKAAAGVTMYSGSGILLNSLAKKALSQPIKGKRHNEYHPLEACMAGLHHTLKNTGNQNDPENPDNAPANNNFSLITGLVPAP